MWFWSIKILFSKSIHLNCEMNSNFVQRSITAFQAWLTDWFHSGKNQTYETAVMNNPYQKIFTSEHFWYQKWQKKFFFFWIFFQYLMIQIAKRFDSLNEQMLPTNDHFKRHSVTYECPLNLVYFHVVNYYSISNINKIWCTSM